MLESTSSKAATPADSKPGSNSNSNPNSHSNSASGADLGSSSNSGGPESTAEPAEPKTDYDLDVDIVLRRRGDTRFTLEVSRKEFDLLDVRAEFVVDMHQTHGLAMNIIRDGIHTITPYVPIKFAEGIDGECIPAPFRGTENALLMDAVLQPEQKHCLLLVEMKPTFPYPEPRKSKLNEEKGKAKEGKIIEDGWKEALRNMQQKMDANNERSRLVMAEMDERSRLVMAEMDERSRLAMAEMEVKVQQLQDDLRRETVRATQAEKDLEVASAAQAENQRDTDEFMASGCREDTTAYYRIKIRHLVNLVQANLAAYCTGLTTELDERNATRHWRQYCSRTAFAKLELDQKVNEVEKLLNSNPKRKPKEIKATNVLINSGALAVLIDDSNLRAIADRAAHPGPLTEENAKEYRVAIDSFKSLADEIQKPDLKRHLEGCVDYLLLVSGM